MLHNGVFTLDERLQHEKLGRKRDFCGAEIFNNGLFRPAKKIYYGYLWLLEESIVIRIARKVVCVKCKQ